jgi:hypothetical protein
VDLRKITRVDGTGPVSCPLMGEGVDINGVGLSNFTTTNSVKLHYGWTCRKPRTCT